MAFLAFALCRLPTLYPVFFCPCGSIARPWRRILYRAIYGRALAFQNKSRFELWELNCEHSVVELKAADRRAIRSDSMERKSLAREVLGFLSRPYHFTRTSKIASDDRKKRNKVLPEIHVIVDNAWPAGMIASKVIHGAGMLKDRCGKS